MISPITKRRIRLLSFFFGLLPVLFCLANTANAQYANVPVTGFNADVVADGLNAEASVSTTHDIDNAGYVLTSTTFGTGSSACPTAISNGLPDNNQVTSTNTTNNTGITYTLQSYGNGATTNNNALRVVAGTSGTFTLATPVSASTLYLLGLGASTYSVTIHFTDATSETVSGIPVPNWCSGEGTYKLTNTVLNRVKRTSGTCGNCPYLFEIPVAISPANYTKLIGSVTINNLVGIPYSIFALGMKSICATPAAPTALSFGTPTTSGISGSFTASAANGYAVVRYPSGSTPTTPLNGTTYTAGMSLGAGTVVSTGNTNSFTATGLSSQTTYDFYIYGYNNASNCGGPIYSMALTGSQTTESCGALITGTTPDTVCDGIQATIQAAANAGSMIKWYAGATGGTALGTGNSFTTPILTATTSYYAEAAKLASVGYTGKNMAGTPYISFDPYGLQFNALSTIVIDSVAVWVAGNGDIQIDVRNSANTILATKTVAISGTGATFSSPVKVYIPLNFNVPAGTNYRLVSGDNTTVDMTRETSGVSGYPYTILGAISLTAAIKNGTPSTSEYFFFYEVHVSTNCINPNREPVTATVLHHPTISYNAATVLPNTTNTCISPNASISIIDTTGVNTTSGTAPRIWYKKGSMVTGNQNTFPATNDNTTDGWKWVESSSTASPYSFLIDHNKLFGGATTGDTIYYFVMAQNTNGVPGVNTASFPAAYCPPSVALSAGAFPLSSVSNRYVLLPHATTAVATATTTFSCTDGTTTLNTTAPPTGDNIQWQSASSGSNMWVNITGATSASYTTGTLTGDTNFRCVITDCGNNVSATSNTIVYIGTPRVISTMPDTVCSGNPAILAATTGSNSFVNWYAAATGGAALGTGNNFTTPVLNATTNYYAEAVTQIPGGYTGRGNNSATGSYGPTSNNGYGVQFTAAAEIRIDSVAIWVNANAGTFTFQLRNAADAVLMSRTVSLSGMGGTSSSLAKVYVPLNFNVTAGTGYRLVAVNTSVAMKRETTISNPYPYTIPGVMSITSSISNGSPDGSRYYFFYEVHASKYCVNSTRQVVTATVTDATVDITSTMPSMDCGDATAIALNSNVPVTWSLPAGNLYTDANGTTAYTNGTMTDSVFAKAVNNRYVKGTYETGGCMFADSVFITINNPATAVMIADNTGMPNTDSGIVNNAAANLHNADCELMATITPSGSSPVSGWLTGKVIMDASVQNTATGPYATRHFELTPAMNSSTAAANITLYFTQAEFDAYNTYVMDNGIAAANPLLPAAPGGSTNDIFVDKFNAASGSPGPTNNNGAVAITPTSVTWDAANSWWAVTFPTTGFSGFFLHTSTSGTPLPIVWKEVSASLDGEKHAVINWSVSEKEAAAYHILKSTDGSRFEKLATLNSKGNGNNAYSYTEGKALNGKAWYRIAQVSKDGKEAYSKIMELQNSSLYGMIRIYPNPATQVLTVETETAAAYSIYDLQGKVILKGNLQSGKNNLDISSFAKGFYTIKVGDYNQKIVLQ